MKVQVWGSQGSYPKPLSNGELMSKIREIMDRIDVSDLISEKSKDNFIKSLPFHLTHTYGGNSSCYSAVSDGEVFIFDAGTGIIAAGQEMASKHLLKTTDTVNLFLSHTHWDHIQGLPFFAPPLWMKDLTINIYSPMKHLKKRLDGQMFPQYLPFTLENVAAKINIIEMDVDSPLEIGKHTVRSMRQYHPGSSYSYRLDNTESGKSFGYTADTELNVNSVKYFDKSVRFFKDCSLLICDTQYLVAEAFQKIDWGHSSTSVMLDLCLNAHVGKMVLSHHEPNYSDEKIYEIFLKTKKYLQMTNDRRSLEVLVAYSGMAVDL